MLTQDTFGAMPDGTEVAVYTIRNSAGYEIRCMTYGATLISVKAPSRDGLIQEITLGYDRLEDYLAGHPYFGSSVGRVCNRIGGARFPLGGREIRLPANEGPNMLHGGAGGFHARVWEAEAFQADARAGVVFGRVSPDGEEGFPGTLDVAITISLTEDNEIEFEYRAETDQPTPVNLTNHAYWNLAGAPDLAPVTTAASGPGGADTPSGAIGSHRLMIRGAELLEVDDASIPTGRVLPVTGTPYDFTEMKPIGRDIENAPGGYDLCWVLSSAGGGNDAALAAVVEEPESGRRMEVLTTLPAIQFYTGNKLPGTKSRADAPHKIHNAFCLETQFHPDAVNRREFPSIILEPGEVFEHRTVYRFSTMT